LFFDPFFRQGEIEAWLWLVSEAAWSPRQRQFEYWSGDLRKGQLVASVRFLEQAWGWRSGAVHRFLMRLKTATRITIDTTTGIMVITICNYSEYQFDNEETATEVKQRHNSSATNENKGRSKTKEKTLKERVESGRKQVFDAEDHEAGDRYSSKQPSKDQEAIIQEVTAWIRGKQTQPSIVMGWEGTELAIREAFNEVHCIAPDRQVREPKDFKRLDRWKQFGWTPEECVSAVRHLLAKKLTEGDSLASLKYVEQYIKGQRGTFAEILRRHQSGGGPRT
jgi:hypothetical protein